ncbi:MAG: glycoside hydrolase family 31 protein [Porphyromonas sp.]|nr:glycoside hydrolase family 31 protein [Porphyromonas sp.]
MNAIRWLCLLTLLSVSHQLWSQTYTTTIAPKGEEKWWGALTAMGGQMPYGTTPMIDFGANNLNNQTSPLLLSSEGRYVWSESPFSFKVSGDTLYIESRYEEVSVTDAGRSLREAYTAAVRAHFPPTGEIPAESFFSLPQYNTWIELMYDQNQEDILAYADAVLEHGFSPGVFMIDDNWQKYYGNFDFKPERFPTPKEMSDRLHRQGFKVMLWVCPYVSPDSPEFRALQQKGYLVRAKGSTAPAIIRWWNGYSACIDLTHPDAVSWLVGELEACQERYGIDGFKFDGADVSYMQEGAYDFYDPEALISDYTRKWAELGLHFPYNEYRATWKMGGQPLVQRLGDKDYSWAAVSALIPEMVAAGLLGHPYTCPDMVGGGQFAAFLNIDSAHFDQELIVRSAQIHALMPMMQFSVAPWRILDEVHLDACRKATELHLGMSDYILQCAREASETGEPIIRNMEYMFPHQGYAEIKDQFMLGERYLIAPMVTPGHQRVVVLPAGRWRDDLGKVHRGPRRLEVTVPIDRVPYYERLK